MSYTDAEMMMATQVAYLNVDYSDRSGSKNVYDIVTAILKDYGTYDSKTGKYVPKGALSGQIKAQFETAQNIMDLAEKNNTTSWRNWEVVDVCNNEESSGFYACLIDTGDENAIVGCRGSESSSAKQTVLDWGVADVGRLNNPETWQQNDATQYMKYLYEKYGDDYNNFSVTGHSLGGSLATHSAISAPKDMQAKIDKVISFDGPGFSDEYLNSHKDGIDRVKDKIYHYEYSFVGALLIQPEGIHNRVIKAHDDEVKSDICWRHLVRHHTRNVEFDENGNVMDGEREYIQVAWGEITKDMDKGHSFVWELLSFKTYALLLLSAYFASVALNGLKDMEQIVNSIRNKAQEIYNNFLALVVSGEYDINTTSICAAAEDIESVNRILQKIAGEVNEISRTLPYDSVSAYYYKHCLRSLSSDLISEGKKAVKISSVANRAAANYNKGDQKVSSLFH